MRRRFVPWWRLRALSGLVWHALREDRIFRIAALGAVLALIFLLGRLFEPPDSGDTPAAVWEALGDPAPASLVLPGRPPVLPPGSLAGGVSAPVGAIPRIDPGQSLDATPQTVPGDRFGTVAPQPLQAGFRP